MGCSTNLLHELVSYLCSFHQVSANPEVFSRYNSGTGSAPSLMKIGQKMAEKTAGRQTEQHKNNTNLTIS
jgi:hypothetical protein